ncbi:hypothetical protein OS493_008011 [Desmophyllum pertusum]|uniref:SAP domain-containing protein n=1 Tax=Desmophyllum pertusum TaxID=174260 RepID=A0A9W9YEW9_9CNID|nr:hypothetical protein OS493_008011 [Desmophyllum pertusum]
MEPDPLDNIMQQLALLVWLRVESMREYFSQCRRKAEKSVKDNMARETLKKHQPYKLNVGNLNKKCKELNIPFKGQKYTLVKMISEQKKKYPTSRNENSMIALMKYITMESLPDPLMEHINNIAKVRSSVQESSRIRKYLATESMPALAQNNHEKYFEVGKKLTIKWTAEEIEDSGW